MMMPGKDEGVKVLNFLVLLSPDTLPLLLSPYTSIKKKGGKEERDNRRKRRIQPWGKKCLKTYASTIKVMEQKIIGWYNSFSPLSW